MDNGQRIEPSLATTEGCCGSRTNVPVSLCGCSSSLSGGSSGGGADAYWFEGHVSTPVGEIPRASTTLQRRDTLGGWGARWGIGRMRYKIDPGLYAIGNPTHESPVFVSANYKMSFDRLRSALAGRNGWIMVLDTKGINVWCAAGKGTFGTEEIVTRIADSRLGEVVSHKKLILPQLGAPGVSAHEVKRQTGFSVTYGPVRASDLQAFIDAGMKATPEMRRVRFTFLDRVVIMPIELVSSAKYLLWFLIGLLVLSGLGHGSYSFTRVMTIGLKSVMLLVGAYLAGAALTPALLPWLPGRAFSLKGAVAGFVVVAAGLACAGTGYRLFENWMSAVAWFLMIPTVASFLAMNFTGASTYTSLSGVKREMRVAVPLQIIGIVLGVGLWVGARFI